VFKRNLNYFLVKKNKTVNAAMVAGFLSGALLIQNGIFAQEGESIMAQMFNQATIPLPDLQKEIETVIRRENNRAEITVGQVIVRKKRLFGLFTSQRPTGICLSREAEKAISASVALAAQMKSSQVELKLLFLSTLVDKKNFVASTLSGYGLSYQVVETKLRLINK